MQGRRPEYGNPYYSQVHPQPLPLHFQNQPIRYVQMTSSGHYPPPHTHRPDMHNQFHRPHFGVQASVPVRQNYHISGPVNRQQVGANMSSSPMNLQNSRNSHSLSPMPHSTAVNFSFRSSNEASSLPPINLPVQPLPQLQPSLPPPSPTPYIAPYLQIQSRINPNTIVQPQKAQPQVQAQQQNFPNPVSVIQQTAVFKAQIIWEQKFIQIYSFFEVFVEKFEIIWEQLFTIEGQFDTVNDEDTWNDLRGRYNDIIGMFSEVRQEIINVLEQNKKTVENVNPETVKNMEQRMNQGQGEEQDNEYQEQENQRQPSGRNNPRDTEDQEEDQNTWQQRYYELMHQHESIIQEAEAMKQALENQGYGGDIEALRREFQERIQALQEENQALRENEGRLAEEYNLAVQHIKAKEESGAWGEHQQKMFEELQTHLNELEERNKYLEQNSSNNQKADNGQQFYELSEKYKKLELQLKEYSSAYFEKQEQVEMHKKNARRLQQRLNNQENSAENRETDNYENIRIQFEEEILKKNSVIKELEQNLNEEAQIAQEKDSLIKELQDTRTKLEKDKYSFEEEIQRLNRIIEELNYEYERLEKRFKEFVEMDTQGQEHQEQNENNKKQMIIELERTLIDKDRKIRGLQAEVEELNEQIFKGLEDREKYIKEIKEFFSHESERQKNIVHEKDAKIKSLQDQLKNFDHELSNKNLEISRFRHQSEKLRVIPPEETKRFTQALQKKNHEIHQLKKTLQLKGLNLKEEQQKVEKTQQQLKYKVFQLQQLKRESYEMGNLKNEVEQLHAVIRKKNMQTNQLRQQILEKQKAEIAMISLQREKIKLNEHLKEQMRECENKDNQIFVLQKKINSLTAESSGNQGGHKISPVSFAENSNSEQMLKQKDIEVRKLKNQKELLETTITTNEKSLRQLSSQLNNHKRINSILKADNTNKLQKIEAELHQLSKSFKKLTNQKQELENELVAAKNKVITLESARQEKGIVMDKEMYSLRERARVAEENSTNLIIDNELAANKMGKLEKEKELLGVKVEELEEKLADKKRIIEELKKKYAEKEKQDSKDFQDKIKNLDNELKLNNLKVGKLEKQIDNLTNKVKTVEQEKKNYKDRLLSAEGSIHTDYQHIDFRKLSQQSLTKQNYIQYIQTQRHFLNQQEGAGLTDIDHSYLGLFGGNQNVLELQKFSLKDSQANNVFERKVIYELKRQNDYLRGELVSIGISSPRSANRVEEVNQQLSVYQQELMTERSKLEENNEVITYHKEKNKELEARIDQLLKVNLELKGKVTNLTATATNQLSLQFYKDQIIKLEEQVEQYQVKIKPLMLENQNLKEELGEYESQCEDLRGKNAENQKKLLEFKDKIRNLEAELHNLENGRINSRNEIERLKDSLIKQRGQKKQVGKIEKNLTEEKRKYSQISDQFAKISNQNAVMKSQIQRLEEKIKTKQFELYLQKEKREEDVSTLQAKIRNMEENLNINSQIKPNNFYNYEIIKAGYSQGGTSRREKDDYDDNFSISHSGLGSDIKEPWRY